jgi:hypothetical protein
VETWRAAAAGADPVGGVSGGNWQSKQANLGVYTKKPPRAAPPRMPPAVGLASRSSFYPVTGSSFPGAVQPGQASFAVRLAQIWWLSPFFGAGAPCP